MTRLALVMIAKDEGRNIGRALVSARTHVDRIIVLDTGSTDATRDIARMAGADVYDFAWRDDFAAARNAALDHSDAAWNLILDADEWIERDAGVLGPGVLPPEGGDFLGQVQVASSLGDGKGTAKAWISRVLPRGVRYEGRIHEQPVSALRQVRLPLVIGHDGYLPEALERKGARNEALLLEEVETHPQDPYLWFQLAKEYQAREKAPQAAVCFAEALRLTPPDAPWRHALVVRAMTAFKAAERFDDALALADAEFPNWQDSPDYFFALGDLYLAWAGRNPEQAMSEHLPLAEFAWKKCLEIGESDHHDGAVAGRGGHMAAHNLAVLYGTLGLKDLEAQFAGLAARLKAAA
ncbi:MAG TPA: glycosyltransferase [Caulobacteraceae bacterium]|nr:glycosyltransferase [Caulobacteraceae bacterium]